MSVTNNKRKKTKQKGQNERRGGKKKDIIIISYYYELTMDNIARALSKLMGTHYKISIFQES